MIDVACAIIEKDGLVLAAQRSERMSLPLKWEFPGEIPGTYCPIQAYPNQMSLATLSALYLLEYANDESTR